MTLLQILKLTLMLSIFLTVFAMAMRARAADCLYLINHWRLGLGAVAAMYVVVPVAAIAMCLIFPFDPALKIALVAVSLSPMPPILPGKQMKAGGRASYVAGMMVLTTAVAIVVAPIGISIAAGIFDVNVSIRPVKIATVVAITVAVPLVLGLIAGWLAGVRGKSISVAVGNIGHVLFTVSLLAIIVALAPAMWAVMGDGTLIALAVIALVGMGAGYLLGGPDKHDRLALSLGAATRHPGVAVAIATTTFPDEKLAVAAVVLSVIVSTILGIPAIRLLAARDDEPVLAPSGGID